ncbi:MAG: hypothetical protein U0893_23300 [Chloroflexota bacterium]
MVEPVLRELDRRGVSYRAMLAEPSATVARQDGVEHVALTGATPAERAAEVLAVRPGVLLLGTSVQAVVERELSVLVRAAVPRVPTLGVLDAMLFVERRFGDGLGELPDLLAVPDEATRRRLLAAGAPGSAVIVTGNPTLEEIGTAPSPNPYCPPVRGRGETVIRPFSPLPRTGEGLGEGASPIDVLFVSSPVAAMRLRGAVFAIDEREALEDMLAVLAELRECAPAGFRVRVRLHPVQRAEPLPTPPGGIALVPDDDPDRLASCARSDLVVGLSSTLLGEARFLPRPAIAYLPGPFWDHERVFAPEYGVELARSRAELHQMVGRALREPPAPAPLAGHVGAAARIADELARLLDR